ncbi:ATP phosphoribosyltransferase, regulatory subunit [Rubidibacter lacunae KORDI 51-2]|uniref:ATP phosphoribosyltransferase regulatory subunit n=1 Tax=Rubidibacter lacunae KORDI 51-2 TaxID=582515 RepID=U5DKS4_9CHRO|nr:ATP phosphoribosyltransferase regulatory subunit [Rubidibacter lacunae]ERN40325.1 ATP phosphoribosyltransferase, regulatory subunit [Rubidibacter lacunae KORDI 51-2]
MTATPQPPASARDWLPLEVEQKLWIGDRLQQVFRQWGYQRVVTSTLERLETLEAGGAIQPQTVIQVQDISEGILGLRPELTASLARACMARMANKSSPLRLYYASNVFRRSVSHHGRQVEFYQLGVELLGAGSVLADAEVLLLAIACVQAVGLPNWQIVLGEASLTRALLQPFPEQLRSRVRYCLAHLDRVTLAQLPLDPSLLDRALRLFDLRGRPAEVLQRVAGLELDVEARAATERLKSLIEILAQTTTEVTLLLDLSLVQTIDYYTGATFEVAVQTATGARVLGSGGRYDRLLELYHPRGERRAGMGFAFGLEELHAALLPTQQLPQMAATSDWLVVPLESAAEVAAFKRARALRQTTPTSKVELELDASTQAEARDRARICGIKNIVWVGADGSFETEAIAVQ